MRDLDAYQDAFARTLRGDPTALGPWLFAAPGQGDGLAVYRNTVVRGAVDALAATYTTVITMVGEPWFRAAGAIYADDNPPDEPSLMRYGADFPDWLARFPPAHDTPYLPGIARLDRAWWESYFAGDAQGLSAKDLAGLEATDLEMTAVRLHPSVRLMAFDQSLLSLWRDHRDDAGTPETFQIEDRPEFALMIRSGIEVQALGLTPGEYAFLTACMAGHSLIVAAESALSADPQASFPQIVASCLENGVFSHLECVDAAPSHDN